MIKSTLKYIIQIFPFLSVTQKGSFAQNFAYIVSSNFLGMALGFLFTPIIARLYSPHSIGVFAFFLAISYTLSGVASLQFPTGLPILKDIKEFRKLSTVTIYCGFGFSVLIFAFFISSFFWLQNFDAFNSLGLYVFIIPPFVFLVVLNEVFFSINIRNKDFAKSARAKAITTVSAKSITVLFGLLSVTGSLGLILAELISKPIDFFLLNANRKKVQILNVFKRLSIKEIWITIKNNKNYPTLVLPNVFILNFSNQLPVFFLTAFFSNAEVGYYAYANGLLNIPIMLLAVSIAPVFLQKASETYHNNPEDVKHLLYRLFKKQFMLSIFSFSFIILFSEEIFRLLFGDKWVLSGTYAGFMAAHCIFGTISSSIGSIFRIYNKEHINLYITVISIVLKLIGLGIGVYYNNIFYAIIGFSIFSALSYIIHIYFAFIITGSSKKNILTPLLLGITVLIFLYFIKNYYF